MKAQAYFSEKQTGVVIFGDDDRDIATLPLMESTSKSADTALKRIGLKRRGAWKKREWGVEASVVFANDKAQPRPSA